MSSWLFRFAHLLGRRASTRHRRRELVAASQLWQRRTGVAANAIAVGIGTGDRPLPALLLGLRLGAYELHFDSELHGQRVSAAVAHDSLLGGGLRVQVRSPQPFHDPMWSPDAALVAQPLPTLVGRVGDRDVSVEKLFFSSLGHDDDLDGYVVGEARAVQVGNLEARSTAWSGYVLGLGRVSTTWRGKLDNVEVTLRPAPSQPRWTGLAARVRRRAEGGRWRSAAEWATWRRASLPPDLPPVTHVDLTFPEPVVVATAERFLLDLSWPLDLFAGRRLTPAGIWSGDQQVGRLLDLGRPLLEQGRKIVVPNRTVLPNYLEQVLPVWEALTEADRQTVKVGISVWEALPVDLEPAVVVGGMGLEYLAASLLPPASNAYDLTKAQRKEIHEGLRELADRVAPRTRWHQDLKRVGSRLFQAPTTDRVTDLCTTYRVEARPEELKSYLGARNDIVHGRAGTVDLDHKIEAMLFERHAIAEVLLRRLGYQGPVWDARQGRRLKP